MPAPNDPNSSELQRDQPAIEPGPTPVEESAAFSMEEVISEIIPNPETVSAIIEFLNQEQLEPEDVEVTAGMWGWDESADIATIKHGTKEFFVAPDWETCKSMALALVKNDLDNEPDIFSPDFMEAHINVDRLRDTLMSDVEEHIRDAADAYNLDPESENFDDEAHAAAEKELADPIQYLKDIYGNEDGMKQAMQWGGINIEEAAEDAVAADGPGHFLASYDGDIHELPGGGYYWRHN